MGRRPTIRIIVSRGNRRHAVTNALPISTQRARHELHMVPAVLPRTHPIVGQTAPDIMAHGP